MVPLSHYPSMPEDGSESQTSDERAEMGNHDRAAVPTDPRTTADVTPTVDAASGVPGQPTSAGPAWRLVYRTEYGRDDESAVTALAFALSEARGVDPLDLESPVYEAVDADAIESFVRPGAAPNTPRDFGAISFTYEEYAVVVERDGTIDVFEPVE